jgi:hypothetical protein
MVLAVATAAAADDAPLSTDRPDRTESAHTVPRGRWQLEMDVASWARHDGADGAPGVQEALDLAAFNVKFGLTDRADVQLVMTPWSRVRHTPPAGEATEDTGPGEASARLKLRVVHGEGVAMALMPYVTTPIRGDARGEIVAWGLLAPVAFPLAGGRALGVMAVVEKQVGLDAWTGGSVTFASPLAGPVSGFAEIFATRAGFTSGAPADVTLDAGLTWAPHPDLQFDAGVYRGLSESAEDWRLFLGLAVRR